MISMQTSDFADYFTSQSVSLSGSMMLVGSRCLNNRYSVKICVGLADYYRAPNYKPFQQLNLALYGLFMRNFKSH